MNFAQMAWASKGTSKGATKEPLIEPLGAGVMQGWHMTEVITNFDKIVRKLLFSVTVDSMCVIDDDTILIPGPKWFYNCLDTMRRVNGLGTVGYSNSSVLQ